MSNSIITKMTIFPLKDAAVINTILAGGILSGFLCWTFNKKRIKNEEDVVIETSRDKAVQLLRKFPALSLDTQFCAILEEPIALFIQIDPDTSEAFVKCLNELVCIFSSLLQGSSKPSDVARALRARRESLKHMHSLFKKAKQKRPLEASEMQEDIKQISTSLDNFIHNSMQQSNLNIMLLKQ